MKWPVVAWGIVFLLGATATLPAGFRNVQAYNRMHEASGWALSLQIIRMSTHRIGSKP
jgi:hypothetical protein